MFKIKKNVFKRFFILFIGVIVTCEPVFFVTLNKILNVGFGFLKNGIINASEILLLFLIASFSIIKDVIASNGIAH
ncbi:hypothetical protein [Flavobacterium sp. ZT3R17]|uniref:hypothetical protein n=1 Tax=Flavobacterium cryoconiti TaxID=3398736 RepID=UPI003A86A8F3